jgi:hypothetical protein
MVGVNEAPIVTAPEAEVSKLMSDEDGWCNISKSLLIQRCVMLR